MLVVILSSSVRVRKLVEYRRDAIRTLGIAAVLVLAFVCAAAYAFRWPAPAEHSVKVDTAGETGRSLPKRMCSCRAVATARSKRAARHELTTAA